MENNVIITALKSKFIKSSFDIYQKFQRILLYGKTALILMCNYTRYGFLKLGNVFIRGIRFCSLVWILEGGGVTCQTEGTKLRSLRKFHWYTFFSFSLFLGCLVCLKLRMYTYYTDNIYTYVSRNLIEHDILISIFFTCETRDGQYFLQIRASIYILAPGIAKLVVQNPTLKIFVLLSWNSKSCYL